MPDTNVFIGPYVEFLSPVEWPECQGELERAWDKLLNDDRRLKWNIGRGSPRSVRVGRRWMFQFCGVPISKRRHSPRPMFWRMESELGSSGDCMTFDWHTIDQASEIEWFREAYAEELGLLEQIFGQPPTLRWGLVAWLY